MQNYHSQNIIFNLHRIVKITLTIKKLLQSFHHIIGNFTLRSLNGWINNWHQVFVMPCGNPPFANCINEKTKSRLIC